MVDWDWSIQLNRSKFEGSPKSETEFFLTAVDARFTFVKDDNWKVNQVILHQNGRDQTAAWIN